MDLKINVFFICIFILKMITLVCAHLKIKTMKKIITLCFFAVAMILGTQSITAQNIIQVNAVAAEKTKELKQSIKFDSDTEDLVYQAFQEYERKKYSIEKVEAAGQTVSEEDRMKFNNMLAEKFKVLFTPEQYERYLTVSKSPR